MPHSDTFVKGREVHHGTRDGLTMKDTCRQAWWPEFDPQLPVQWKERSESLELSSDLHTHAMACMYPHTHTQQIYNIWSKEKSTLAPWHPGWWFLSGIIFAVTTSSSGMGYTHSSLGSSFREMEFLISSQKKWMNVCMNERMNFVESQPVEVESELLWREPNVAWGSKGS